MEPTVAFIGLGVMGYPMAGHLSRANYRVNVYNRTETRAQSWLDEHQGTAYPSAAEAAKEASLVISCIGGDQDLRNVFLGDNGVFSTMNPGSIVVDHTTASASVARELAVAASARGLHFIDAPVSGGQQGAQNGKLTIMCGGEQDAFDRALPALSCYARAVTLMGPPGSGQLTKMVNQITIAGLIQGLAEGLHFAERSGLDCEKVVDVISKGAAQSWQMENRAPTMIRGEYNHGFAVDHMRKDLGICLESARQCGASLPVAALVDQFYAEVQRMGGQRWDTSSLLEVLRR